MKILYVEDDENQARLVLMLLKSKGYDVEYFNLGQPALDRFLAAPEIWQAALIDLVLPDISGEDIFPHIYEKRPLLPIVINSGTQGMKERYELYTAGASALVPKPFAGQDLLDILEGLIERPPEPIQ